MAARTCPYSLTVLPRGYVVAHSYDLVCPGCQKPLEISRVSRNLSVFVGLVAATAAWYFSQYDVAHHAALGWLMQVVHAILAYAIVTAVLLAFTADLSLKSEPHASEIHASEESGHGGHASGHH
ncbi:MAG: hypothetical protein WCA98_04960 [Candidatus Acidiferrales bacterium]